jgi:Raf kinase inhibitor-like YbhB/YbcL family protein
LAQFFQLLFFLTPKNKSMEIKSTAFKDGETIPVKFTCEGPNVSPPLQFTNVPIEAKSLVLMVEDPEADAKPWVHWLVFNILPDTKGFEENSISAGARQGLCNGNTLGYEGPCPDAKHTYLFKLYALDIMLDADPIPNRAKVLEDIQGHILAEAVLKGVYEKQMQAA